MRMCGIVLLHIAELSYPSSILSTLRIGWRREGRAGYDIVWYGMVWYGMVLYGMVWYGMVWYGMVGYGSVIRVGWRHGRIG